jgi:hypothetical protein
LLLVVACGSAESTTTTAGRTSVTAATTAPATVGATSTTSREPETSTTVEMKTTTTTTTRADVVAVPAAGAPTIDGVLSPGEWDGAVIDSMSDGSLLYWMYRGTTLSVAIAGSDLGAINLAIAGPDDVWVLHSSAALGSLHYTAEPSGWTQVSGFTWCCRSSADPAERLALVEAEGWQANIGFAGDAGVVEYEVLLPWVDHKVAISYQTEAGAPVFWPAELSEEAQRQLIGPWPDHQLFNVAEWPALVLAGESSN